MRKKSKNRKSKGRQAGNFKCPYCYGDVMPDGRCLMCAATIDYSRRRKPVISVRGHKSEEVKDVSIALMSELERQESKAIRNPWISGSFYLAVMLIITSLFLVIAKLVHPIIFPVVCIAAFLGVSIIGALQLRHDGSLSEKNFIELMALTFRQLPFLRRANKEKISQ